MSRAAIGDSSRNGDPGSSKELTEAQDRGERSPELMPDAGQVLAGIVVELRWEGPRADARGIGFDDAEHLVQPARRDLRLAVKMERT